MSALRVVVVDDQALVRAGFRMILEAEPDMEVVGDAADGVQALAAVEEVRPDVVLMDVRMPVLDGLAATRRIRAELPAHDQPRIVAFSADAVASDQAVLLGAGMDDYVSKPVKLATIEGVLRQAAAHRLARSEPAAV